MERQDLPPLKHPPPRTGPRKPPWEVSQSMPRLTKGEQSGTISAQPPTFTTVAQPSTARPRATTPVFLALQAQRAPTACASDLSRALTDISIQVSCVSNEINLEAAVSEQPILAHLAYLTEQLQLMPTDRPPEDEIEYLRTQVKLLKEKDKVWQELAQSWVKRATAVSDVMAQCGFVDNIPCRNNLDILPLSPPVGPPILSIKEVALGQPILEWVNYKMQSYAIDPRHQGKSRGELEQQLWRDLPRELQRWVRKPKAETMAFLGRWYQALDSRKSNLPSELLKCLETMRERAREDHESHCCKTCYPNNHWLVDKPRGFLSNPAYKLFHRS